MQQTATRPPTVTLAAGLCMLNVLLNLATTLTPGIPPPVVVASVLAGLAGLAGAYGVWRLRRWGVIASVVILALTALLAAPGIPFAPSAALHALATATVVLDVIAIALLMVPSSRRAYA